MSDSHIDYKRTDSDEVGTVLKQNGAAVNLTGYTVSFTMKSTDISTPTRYELMCTLGGTVDGKYVPASSGGLTIHFTATETVAVGEYLGEYVVSDGYGNSVSFPSGDNYISITIWERL